MQSYNRFEFLNVLNILFRMIVYILKCLEHSFLVALFVFICPYLELFWSVFFRIWTEYGEISSISPYSVRIRENGHQSNFEHGHFLRRVYSASFFRTGSKVHEERLKFVENEINATGTYQILEDELTYGAKLAWRNAPRCTGRIEWKNLKVYDARHVTTAKEMFDCILRHVRYATNGGNLRSTMTIFPPRAASRGDFRIWNNQLFKYAGYKQTDGNVIGDPASVELTEIAQKLGWKGKGTPFDIMPIILQANGEEPEYFEYPEMDVMEVDICHPT